MAELWLPKTGNTPDVNNLFDMMILFQQELDKKQPGAEQEFFALFSLRTLGMCLKSMHEGTRDLTLITKLAIINATEAPDEGAIVKHVGLRGLLDDVHCIRIGASLPFSYSLGVNVISMFPADSPDDEDLVLSSAQAPISQVEYIETAA